MKKTINTVIKIVIVALEIILPYVTARGATLMNAALNEKAFEGGNALLIFGLPLMLLSPLMFLILDIAVMRVARTGGVWKYAVPGAAVLHFVMMTLTWTGKVPIALYLLTVHTLNEDFIKMFILNNLILLWLSLAEIKKGHD